MCRTRVEAAIGAVRQARNFTVCILRHRIIAFLKHKSSHAHQPQLAGSLAKVIDWLFHGIPNEHQRLYALAGLLLPGMTENFPDLCLPSPAIDARHQFGQPFATSNPTRRAALTEASEISELDIEAADARGFPKTPMSACNAQAVSQVGCRLIVASSAKIKRPRDPGAVAGPSARTRSTNASMSGFDETGAGA